QLKAARVRGGGGGCPTGLFFVFFHVGGPESFAQPKKKTDKKKGVKIAEEDSEGSKKGAQSATLIRTLRASRTSRLTAEGLAALKAKLESEMTSHSSSAEKDKLIEEARRKLPRCETNTLSTLDDLFDELQKEKRAQPANMLSRA